MRIAARMVARVSFENRRERVRRERERERERRIGTNEQAHLHSLGKKRERNKLGARRSDFQLKAVLAAASFSSLIPSYLSLSTLYHPHTTFFYFHTTAADAQR